MPFQLIGSRLDFSSKMVLISWFCGGKYSGVRKTALIGKHKIVALLGDVTQSGN